MTQLTMNLRPGHARAFDIPGWPCPPRVRDIPNTPNSWGMVRVHPTTIATDELRYLWANGDTDPRYDIPNDLHANPGAILYWTESGLGLWIHPNSLSCLRSISQPDMTPDQWLPIAQVASQRPPFVDKPAQTTEETKP